MKEFDLRYSDKIPVKYFESLTANELREQLKTLLLDLLINDFQKLTNLLYRHDVSERKVAIAFNESTDERKAAHLAELVIEREMQKIATRKAYKQYKNQQEQKAINQGKN